MTANLSPADIVARLSAIENDLTAALEAADEERAQELNLEREQLIALLVGTPTDKAQFAAAVQAQNTPTPEDESAKRAATRAQIMALRDNPLA